MRIKHLFLAMIGVMLLSVGSWAQTYSGPVQGRGNSVSSSHRKDGRGFHRRHERRERRRHFKHHRRHHHNHGHAYRGR